MSSGSEFQAFVMHLAKNSALHDFFVLTSSLASCCALGLMGYSPMV